MASHIINGPPTLGARLGTGLSQGISQLLESKINQLGQRNQTAQTASALRAMDPNINEQQSLQLARAPESLLNQHFKNQQSQRLGEREAETVRAWQQANLPQRPQSNELTQNNPELNAQQNAQQTPESIADQQTRQAISGQSQAPQFPGYITPGSGPQHIGIQQKDLARQEQERQNKIKNQRDAETFRAQRLDKEEQKRQKEREYYTNLNRKTIDKIETKADIGKRDIDLSVRGLELLNSGKFKVGPIGGFLTENLSQLVDNPEAAEYRQILNQYVTNKYGETGGLKSKALLDKINDAKTKFRDPIEAQRYFWNKELQEGKNEVIKGFALDDIQAEGDIGKDFKSELNKRVNLYKNMPKDIPNPKTSAPDSLYEDNGVIWAIRNGRWYPLGKGI